jgi:hypothetical protein
LSTDITGTMPPTIFLFALEPNLAILYVSIPMLRPLYMRYRSWSILSRLHDGRHKSNHKSDQTSGTNCIRTIGMMPSREAWEMDEYGLVATQSSWQARTVIKNGVDDHDTSSQKGLVGKAAIPAGGVGVKEQWRII